MNARWWVWLQDALCVVAIFGGAAICLGCKL